MPPGGGRALTAEEFLEAIAGADHAPSRRARAWAQMWVDTRAASKPQLSARLNNMSAMSMHCAAQAAQWTQRWTQQTRLTSDGVVRLRATKATRACDRGP